MSSASSFMCGNAGKIAFILINSSKIARIRDSECVTWDENPSPPSNAPPRVHPSIGLVVRPPSARGTGIFAADDVEANVDVMTLPLGEVGMIDALSVLDSYQRRRSEGGGCDWDEVLETLREFWDSAGGGGGGSSGTKKGAEGRRLAVLVGVVAHLALCESLANGEAGGRNMVAKTAAEEEGTAATRRRAGWRCSTSSRTA